ncbi:uncharacterized protein [Bemisia tabaci]
MQVSILGNLQETELKTSLIQLYEHLLDFTVFHEGGTENDNENEIPQLQENSFVLRNGMPGRPSIILDSNLVNYYNTNGLSKKEIAKAFKVSRRTLYRKVGVAKMPTLSDEDLRNLIIEMKEEDQSCGQPYITGEVRARGYYISRHRIRKQLRIVDPVGSVRRRRFIARRRRYRVRGPNYLWHMDGNEKLQLVGMYIHGLVDGYSRKCLSLVISNNKKAGTVKEAFKTATQQFGWPKRVRSDKGLENIGVARCMLERRGPETKPFITGRSIHNVRIERFWREVNKITERFKVLFRNLQEIEALDLNNEENFFYLQYIFIPVIQKFLSRFALRWNAYDIRTAKNTAPNILFNRGEKSPDVEGEFESSEDDSDDDEILLNETEQLWRERAETLCPNPADFSEYESVENFVNLCHII